MKIRTDWKAVNFQEIIDLYQAVGWSAYTEDIQGLVLALSQSTYVAFHVQDNKVVGLVRSLSDGVSIHFLQDVLVLPEYQGKGIGRALINSALSKFEKCRTHLLMTDDEEKQLKFYKSLGYSNTRELEKMPLNCFVKMRGVELS
jgi:ribosomal protein S18 acetylase RimI-like enzyme